MKNRILTILSSSVLALCSMQAGAADNSYIKINGEIIPTTQVSKKNVISNGAVIQLAGRNDNDRYMTCGSLEIWAPRGAVFTIRRDNTTGLGNWCGFLRFHDSKMDGGICKVVGNNSGKEIRSSDDEMSFTLCPNDESVTVTMTTSSGYLAESYDASSTHLQVRCQRGQESWLLRWATMRVNIHVARYKYAISFDSMGGSAVPTQYNAGGWIESTTFKLKANTTNTPTRMGYTFEGWYDQPYGGSRVSNNTEYNIQGDVNAVAAVTLYAHWTPTPYTATFDANGGTAEFASKEYNIEGTLQFPTVSGVEGKYALWEVYSPVGNWTAAEIFAPGQVIPAGRYGNVKFKAAWGDMAYLVTGSFDDSNAQLEITNTPQIANHGMAITPMVFTPKTGYEITAVKVNGSPVSGSFPVDVYTHNQTITATTEIVAYTALKKFTFTATVDNESHATISGLSPQTVQYGSSNKEVTFKANTGYQIADIRVNGVSVGAKFPVLEYSFSQAITETTNVVAVTQVKTYSVTITVDGLKDNDHAIVEVRNGGTLTHRIPVDATNPEVKLRNIQEGSNLSVSLTGWSWMYNNPVSQQKTITGNTSFDFSVSSKSESRQHGETRKTHWTIND